MISVCALSGSLRRGSYNTGLLRAAQELAPAGMAIELVGLEKLPLYDADVEREEGFPAAVHELRTAIVEADAILIATPEYNFSVSGVLKNAIDWASRGGKDSPLSGKPAAIMGAGGRSGTLRAQLHLRQILQHNHLRLVLRPEVMVDRAWERFDADGRLVEERFRDQIRRLLAGLADEVRLHRLT